MKLWPYVPKFAGDCPARRSAALPYGMQRPSDMSEQVSHKHQSPLYAFVHLIIHPLRCPHRKSGLEGSGLRCISRPILLDRGTVDAAAVFIRCLFLAVCYMTYSSYMGSSLSSGCVQRPLELGGADLPSIEHAEALAGGVGDGAVGHVDAGALGEEQHEAEVVGGVPRGRARGRHGLAGDRNGRVSARAWMDKAQVQQ